MIEFQHVFKSYGRGRNILADINFRVSAGEFVFVSGPSGAGKSTLLKLIGGLEPASRGSIQVNGQRLDKLPARARPYLRRAVGVILQDTHLLFDRSAFENVMLPLAVQGQPWDSAAARARAALDKVGLSGKEDLNPIELSGGEQQRLAIARAIVNRPAILIADEPTANLDHDNAQRIMNVFRDFNRVGVTTLIASHDQDLMARYATRTLRIDPGKFADSAGTAPPPEAGQGQAAPTRTGGGRAEPGFGHPGESA
ncbi:cell division ATP-binding protein FtsE [Achromobacter marplatensis]|jgi:cell division transport system ATP-binding protein|nr:ATP-binding cassette domain-containing protein [Achromobacter marplatensis]OWT57710.1 cell division ATP-binding protein FtsE [Achromobacter marplatensis]RBP14181.1 cell division ATP-binding protein FtsE [Achromobacter marplatensis]CAB3706626.1 Cell division ATP-binding protein FtsE [Achromobacter marplatensis]